MLNLQLNLASERRLAEEARKLGLTPERYAVRLLQEAMSVRGNPSRPAVVPSNQITDEEWECELDGLIGDQDDSAPPIPDEALRRENLYEDRS